MKQRNKKRQVRRRLMTGLFCISLLAADLTPAIPAWAQESAVAYALAGSDAEQRLDEVHTGEDVQSPNEGNAGNMAQTSEDDDEGNKGNTAQTPEDSGDGNEGNVSQDPDEGQEDIPQEPGDGNDAPQTPETGEENNKEESETPDQEKDGDEAQEPDGKEETEDTEDTEDTDASDEEEEGGDENGTEEPGDVTDDNVEDPAVSDEEETTEAEGPDAVSENDLEEQTSVRTLAVPDDAIASGAYQDITWVIDADGKLTVEGTGEFAPSNNYRPNARRAPWCAVSSDVTMSIRSAEVRVTGMTDASCMFKDCYNLEAVNFDGFDTSTVTNMAYMFEGNPYLSKLKKLDLGQHFDTKNVTDMSSMFGSQANLESINLGAKFDTGNVTDMSFMFSGCSVLKDVSVSGFNTANVTDMSSMFEQCCAIGDLDLSGWDTSRVTHMDSMFMDCDFDSLKLGGSFTTKSATQLNHMFAWYRRNSAAEGYVALSPDRIKLKGIDLSWIDLSNEPIVSGIFEGCDIRGLDLGRLDTSVTTSLIGLFSGCDLTGVDFSGLQTDTITSMQGMFISCKGTIDLRTLAHENVTYMSTMFEAAYTAENQQPPTQYLTSLDVSSLDTSKVTNMTAMFRNQKQLTELDLSGFDVSKVDGMNYMFSGCSSLRKLDLSGWHVEGIRYAPGWFTDCKNLTSLDLSGFNFEKASSGKIDMGIDTCSKLETIYTPYNVKGEVALPDGDWYMADGTKLETNFFPKNLAYSVLLQKGKKPAVSAARMEVSKKKTTYGCGETINTDDLTVMYYGKDGKVRKLTDGEYTTNADTLTTFEPGTAELVVTCKLDGGSLSAKIKLTIAYVLTENNATITLPSESDYDYTYDGQPKTPGPVSVSYAKKAADGTESLVPLTEGKEYTVSYRNHINAYEQSVTDEPSDGTDSATVAAGSTEKVPTVIIKGTGSYSGTVTKTFAIHKAEAPAAETLEVTASQCMQAQTGRTADLGVSFAACGKKTGYELISVDDPQNIFTKEPVTADIKDGVLTYSTNAAQENDTASLKIKVSFANYQDAELTVKIVMVSKKAAVISGIVMPESMVYSGAPASYSGDAVVRAEDGTNLTGKVTLVYSYSGTLADGTVYPAAGGTDEGMTAEAPVHAGSYVLTVMVPEDDPEYTGSKTYPFEIVPAEAAVKARDITVLMQTAQGEDEIMVPVEQYQAAFGYDLTGLLGTDTLKKEPAYTVTEDEDGTKPVTAINMSKAGAYYIQPAGADAGMNYQIAYKPGVFTVSEERVAYTVTFDGMGRCDGFVKSGIKAGALLELSDSEQTPEAKEKGYVFAGWYQDRTFAKGKEWNFETDTVQSDITLYACWLTAAAQEGDGLKLCVQEIPDLVYTGSAQKPEITVYDSDGVTPLKLGKDYTVKYVRNMDAVAVGEDGQPVVAGGTAKVTNPGKTGEQITDVIGHFSKECPYVVITGKGNYSETVYRNFLILPAQISADGTDGQTLQQDFTKDADNTPLAAGFTMKYTDQFEAKANKTAKIITSFKYKKALKADQDYTVSVADESGRNIALTQGKLPLNAGVYTMTVTGKGNYAGTVRRKLYVAEKQKLMKNASVSYTKTIAADGADALLKGIEQKNITVKISGQEIPAQNYTIDYAGTNHAVGTATMTLTGKDGYVGTKSVTFKITGAAFGAGTVAVQAYDAGRPDEDDWKASMSYTGKAVTQNKVTLMTKVTTKNPMAQKLVYGEHYTIAYKNNVKKGTATMIFTAKPESGYSGSFKKTFKITAQELAKDRVKVEPSAQDGVSYSKNGARLPFVITNEAGTVLREGTDYTVKYKNNNAVTTDQTDDNKKPLMTITGKGNYTGKVEVSFAVKPVSIEAAIDGQIVNVTCAQVQNKSSMKFKDFKFKLVEGKKTLGAGETKDYIIDETKCTPDMIKAYAEAVAAGTASSQEEPVVTVEGRGGYTGKKAIPLGTYIYADKLTAAQLYVVVSEGKGQNEYTGSQVTPDVAVYYGEKTAVAAAKKDKVKDENTLTAAAGSYKLTKLSAGDYTLSYGANLAAGANKGSVTVTGAGRYGGSVTVKFTIEKKAIW